MSDDFEYDVFLSHNSVDKPVVEEIARRLRDAGVRPFLDKWHLVPGMRWQTGIETALSRSGTAAILIGPDSEGPWQHEELQLALNKAARSRDEFRVIPVLLPGAHPRDFDGFLETRTWVDFRSGIDDSEAFVRLVSGVRGKVVESGNDGLPDDSAPYRGLLRFEAEHARLFFGRDTDTRRLVEKLARQNFVAVVGASGSGKSSLVRAGLLPSLDEDAVSGSRQWVKLVVLPGADPLRALADQLSTLSPPEDRQRKADELTKRFTEFPDGLRSSTSNLVAERPRPLLLVIDQFEELFTHRPDEESETSTAQFIANITDAVSRGAGSIRIVLTLRADFLERCLGFASLRAMLEDGQLLLGNLRDEDLREVIQRPAREVGAFLEKGLVSLILQDLSGQPGSLPLLQHVLHELWIARRGRWLTIDAYERAGRMSGALERRAQSTLDSLGTGERRIARNIFLRLTSVEGFTTTRRRAQREELYPADADRQQVDAVIDKLSGSDSRLIVADSSTVEIAHETLISRWKTLAHWVDENRENLEIHGRVRDAAAEWDRNVRDTSYLLVGVRLAELEEWSRDHVENLNPVERAFLDDSLSQRDRRRETRERLTRRIALGSSIGFIVAMILAGVALHQWGRANDLRVEAEREKERANKSATLARAHSLAARASLMIKEERHLLPRAVLLAAESLEQVPSSETRQVLRDGLSLLPRKQARLAHGDVVYALDLHPTSRVVATASGDHTARIWDTESGREIARLVHEQNVVDVAFKPPRGEYLATASYDGTIRIWNSESKSEHKRIQFGGWVDALTYTRDGRYLAGGSWNHRVLVYEERTDEVFELEGHTSVVRSLAFSPSGRYLATGSQDRTVRIWDLKVRRAAKTLKLASIVNVVEFGATDADLLTADFRSARVWSWADEKVQSSASRAGATIASAGFAPGGDIVATGWSDGEIRVWSSRNGGLISRMKHAGNVNSVIFDKSPDRLLSTSDDATARVWSVSRGAEILVMQHKRSVTDVSVLSDGRTIVTSSFDGSAIVWKTESVVESVLEHTSRGQGRSIDFSFDDELVAVASAEPAVRVWRVEDRTQWTVLQHEKNAVTQVLFSPTERRIATVGGSIGSAVVTVWNLAERSKVEATMDTNHDEPPISFSATGDHLAVGVDTGVAVWHLATRQVVTRVPCGKVTDVEFLPESTRLATSSSSGELAIWDWKSGIKLREFRADSWVNDIDCSPAGTLLACTSGGVGRDNWVHVWEIATGQEVRRLHHSSTPRSVEFSSRGTYLAAAGWDRTARVWELDSWRQIASFEHNDSIVSVAFSADERWLGTAGWDHKAKVWRISPDLLIRSAREIVGRPLTAAEQVEYLIDE